MLADHQKFVFKNNSETRDLWINTGLWRYSRHPNYAGTGGFEDAVTTRRSSGQSDQTRPIHRDGRRPIWLSTRIADHACSVRLASAPGEIILWVGIFVLCFSAFDRGQTWFLKRLAVSHQAPARLGPNLRAWQAT